MHYTMAYILYCVSGALGGLKMGVSIMEALQNADYNLDNAMKVPMLLPMVKEQLHNATVLLDKGYNIWTEVEPLLEKWGSVENVPELDDNDDINQDH